MTPKFKHRAMVAVAAAAVIAGIVIAIATTGHGHAHGRHQHGHGHEHAHRHGSPAEAARPGGSAAAGGELAVAASYLGLTKAQVRRGLVTHDTLAQLANATSGRSATGLIAALVAARTARLEMAVASGRLSEAKLQAGAAGLHARALALVERPYAAARAGGDLSVAAGYLGVTAAQLRSELRSGRSLAQLAAARHRTSAGLIDAIVTRRRARLAVAAANGHLSPAREQARVAMLRKRATAEVNRARAKPAG